ncbi:hypothetical protein [Thalassotalea agariperforans]
MSGQTMVVCIVLITVVFGTLFDMYKKHLAFKEKMLKHNQASDADNEQLKQQVTNLESRIQVLEKIVTDEGYSIKKEINGL